MALFTDGGITQIADITAYDAAILKVSNAEGVDLDVKLGLATTEIGIAIEDFLARRTGRKPSADTATGQALGNVVVTPPLKQWHTLLTLALTYADIEGNHLQGRYGEKAKWYRNRARAAAETLYRIGVGLTFMPVPRATKPVVRTVAAVTPGGTYRLRVNWRNAAGETGAASEEVIYATGPGGVVGVRTQDAPADVTGFDVYAGETAGSLTKQNAGAIATGAEWVMPASGLVKGSPLGDGQAPDRFVRNDRVLQRG